MIAASSQADFKDWLSPMLVKELRQGLRSRVFVSAFYLCQALMILTTVLQMISASIPNNVGDMAGFMNAIFWFMIGVPLLFVMPLRGFGALHAEIKAGTLELVFLTRLSAWKIAAGKWLALVVQTLLLICSVLPYVVLRYFVGGVDLIDDLQKVAFLLTGSALLTAATIALSPYESKLVRALFIFGMIFAAQFIAGIFFTWLAVGQLNPTGTAPWAGYLAGAVFAIAFIALALELAASKIAPPAENHALIKRLIGLAVLLFAVIFSFFTSEQEMVFGFAILFFVPVLIDALAEPLRFVRSHHASFSRFPSGAVILRIFFLPGWVSGFWFTVLLAAVLSLGMLISGLWANESFLLMAVSFFGTLLLPAALIRLVAPSTPNFLGFYIALQFALAAITLLVSIMGGIADQNYQLWLCWLPNSVLWWTLFSVTSSDNIPVLLVTSSIMTLLGAMLLFFRCLAPSRDIRSQLRQTAPAHV